MKSHLRIVFGLVVLALLAACEGPTPAPSTATPAPTIAAATAMPATVAVSTITGTPSPATPAATTQASAASGAAKSKPNIVFVLTDDLDAAEIQFMPKLKSLIADQGMTFDNYFVAMSLCCPSRATTLRGQYPHNTEILGNSLPTGGFQKFFQLGEEKSTVAVWLQDAGYRTMLAGKYLNGYPDKSNAMYIPPGWTEWYSAMKGNPYSEYNYTLNENGKQVAYGKTAQDYGADVYVRKTTDFIQRSAKDGKPFFVYLAPYAPHSPYTPAPRHADLFPGAKAPRTPNYNEADVSDKPAYIKDRPLLTTKQMDTIDQDYRKRLQALQAVDEGIEAIVNALKASGQLDNTYIFFTSDNGYHLGNHRQITGKITPYQEELRVTMIVRGPGVPAGKTVPHLSGNADLAPTWADLAGAKLPDFVDGRSLVPLMRGSSIPLDQWRQVYPIENGEMRAARTQSTPGLIPVTDAGLLEQPDGDANRMAALSTAQQNRLAVPPLRGIRMQTTSYIEYNTGEKEYYDIQADPYQLQNLAGKADPKLLAVLSARVKALAACKGAACRTVEDAPLNLPK
ncbi:MAG: sulfatase [Chloroflexi bacterium]|nr:sulfatase [Chloroflexota bacterium]